MSDIEYEAFMVIVNVSENRFASVATMDRVYEGPMSLEEALQKAKAYHDPSGYSHAVVELKLLKP